MTKMRVNEIDLLRFIAALSVVIFHYSFRGYAGDNMSVMPYPLLESAAKYGYLGVELFFMISGFVILMTAENGSLRGFVISRILRLYPAFWVCCTITFVTIMLIGAPRYSATVEQWLVNMTMISGFVGVPAIDGVYWSLFVELKFYALVAVVLLVGRIHQAETFILAWLAATILLEAYPVKLLRFLLVTDCGAFFIAGATCFLIWKKGLSFTRAAVVAVSWALALYQAKGKVESLENHYDTMFNGFVVAGIITSFFLVMLVVSLKRTGWLGQTRWLLVGAITYPLYLLHQKIGYMVFNAAYPAVNAHLLFWATIGGSVVLAYLIHVLVEKRFSSPMKKGLNRIADRVEHFCGPLTIRSR